MNVYSFLFLGNLTLASTANSQIMNKSLLFVFILLTVFGFSCKEKGYAKPEQFISETEMVDILYDIHFAEALASHFTYNIADSVKLGSKEFYQTVLEKYQLEDSVLTRNIIYYSARPKVYEKIYEQVVERILMQQEEVMKKENMSVTE